MTHHGLNYALKFNSNAHCLLKDTCKIHPLLLNKEVGMQKIINNGVVYCGMIRNSNIVTKL